VQEVEVELVQQEKMHKLEVVQQYIKQEMVEQEKI
jgi:hypothetical protein